MPLCILTDTTALFPPTSPGGARFLRALELNLAGSSLCQPDLAEYQQTFTELEHEFNSILVLAGSEEIYPVVETAHQAAKSHGGSARVEVLDTLQIGPGLGILAYLAARKAAAGMSLFEVKDIIRSLVPNIFTVICPDTLPSYVTGKHMLPSGNNGEQAGTLQVYSLEEGLLVPYKKVRTQRHLLEIFQEFLEDFERPQQFVYFHGKSAGLHVRPLREAVDGLFPGTQFLDLELNKALAGMFGEHTVGLTVLEMPPGKG